MGLWGSHSKGTLLLPRCRIRGQYLFPPTRLSSCTTSAGIYKSTPRSILYLLNAQGLLIAAAASFPDVTKIDYRHSSPGLIYYQECSPLNQVRNHRESSRSAGLRIVQYLTRFMLCFANITPEGKVIGAPVRERFVVCRHCNTGINDHGDCVGCNGSRDETL